MNAARVKAIADFVRCGYSEFGVEIAAEGANSLTLTLPAAFPLTPLAADLWNEFEAPVDFKNGPNNEPVLTVWLHKGDTASPHRRQEWPPPSTPSRCSSAVTVSLGVVLSLAANWVAANLPLLHNRTLYELLDTLR